MDTFIQLTIDALTLGSVYALIALGYTLVYGVLKLLNFAHGDVFMVGSFIGFGMLNLLGGSAPNSNCIELARKNETPSALISGAIRGALRNGR